MATRARPRIAGKSGAAAPIGIVGLGIMGGDMARAVGAPVPLFSNCAALYNAAMALGLAQADSASVCEVFDAMTGSAQRR